MFGKRSTTGASRAPPPERAPAWEPQRSSASPAKAVPKPSCGPPNRVREDRFRPRPSASRSSARSEEYYDVKTTVFNALIDTIDLTQLAKLEPEAAREEIRDIVSKIVAIKTW
jgi:pilus assembly protein CpaF